LAGINFTATSDRTTEFEELKEPMRSCVNGVSERGVCV